MKKPHPTLRTIAKKAGCSIATVSMALRNDSRLSVETLKRIQSLADKVGYLSNPEISSLMSRIRSQQLEPKGETIAFVYYQRKNEEWMRVPMRIYEGAKKEAARFGCSVEMLCLNTPGMSVAKLNKTLRARGIRAVIIAPFPNQWEKLDLQWDYFSSVAIGPSLVSPNLNRINNSQYHTARLAFQKLVELGYRRIGFVTERVHNQRLQGAFLGGFLASQHDFPDLHPVSPLVIEKPQWKTFKTWFTHEKPDAIIGESYFRELQDGKLPGISIPESLGLAFTNTELNDGVSGIFQDHQRFGEEAVRKVLNQVHRNEFGIPKNASALVTYGKWENGTTTRHQAK